MKEKTDHPHLIKETKLADEYRIPEEYRNLIYKIREKYVKQTDERKTWLDCPDKAEVEDLELQIFGDEYIKYRKDNPDSEILTRGNMSQLMVNASKINFSVWRSALNPSSPQRRAFDNTKGDLYDRLVAASEKVPYGMDRENDKPRRRNMQGRRHNSLKF